jgi:type II secretory pathway pseudopilin PulG
LSLFEVLIALAVLGCAVGAAGPLIGNGLQAGKRARLTTEAILRCQSKAAEVLAGIEPLRSRRNLPLADDSGWTWSLAIDRPLPSGVQPIQVTVEHTATKVSFSLRQLVQSEATVMEDELL